MKTLRNLFIVSVLVFSSLGHAGSETSTMKKTVYASVVGMVAGFITAYATCDHDSGVYTSPQWVFLAPFYGMFGTIVAPLSYLAYKNFVGGGRKVYPDELKDV